MVNCWVLQVRCHVYIRSATETAAAPSGSVAAPLKPLMHHVNEPRSSMAQRLRPKYLWIAVGLGFTPSPLVELSFRTERYELRVESADADEPGAVLQSERGQEG